MQLLLLQLLLLQLKLQGTADTPLMLHFNLTGLDESEVTISQMIEKPLMQHDNELSLNSSSICQ